MMDGGSWMFVECSCKSNGFEEIKDEKFSGNVYDADRCRGFKAVDAFRCFLTIDQKPKTKKSSGMAKNREKQRFKKVVEHPKVFGNSVSKKQWKIVKFVSIERTLSLYVTRKKGLSCHHYYALFRLSFTRRYF
jgi:hypothetical protein